jgi:NTE family protein
VRQGIVYGVTTMRPSFVSAEEFAGSMANILPDVRIEELPTRFGAVCLDLQGGEEVLLCRGHLRDVCAASSAIPGILPPRKINGRVLIDGGWVDKVPVLPAFRMGADVVIAVDISAELDARRDYTRGIEIMLRANLIKDAALTAFQKRIADVVIEPSVRRVHWADFEAYDFCIAAGDLAASAAIPQIREFLNHERWRSLLRPSAGRRLADLYLSSPDLRFCVE